MARTSKGTSNWKLEMPWLVEHGFASHDSFVLFIYTVINIDSIEKDTEEASKEARKEVHKWKEVEDFLGDRLEQANQKTRGSRSSKRRMPPWTKRSR